VKSGKSQATFRRLPMTLHVCSLLIYKAGTILNSPQMIAMLRSAWKPSGTFLLRWRRGAVSRWRSLSTHRLRNPASCNHMPRDCSRNNSRLIAFAWHVSTCNRGTPTMGKTSGAQALQICGSY
jgi:hypothetical protein